MPHIKGSGKRKHGRSLSNENGGGFAWKSEVLRGIVSVFARCHWRLKGVWQEREIFDNGEREKRGGTSIQMGISACKSWELREALVCGTVSGARAEREAWKRDLARNVEE